MRSIELSDTEEKPNGAGRFCLSGCLILIIVFIGWNLFHVFASARLASRYAKGVSSVKELAIAMSLYAEKNGDRFPPASNWSDAIEPYRKTHEPNVDPIQPSTDYGYAMNRELSGASINSLDHPSDTILLYETKRPGRNLSSPPAEIPTDAYSEDWTYVAFADTHAKRLSKRTLAEAMRNKAH